MPVCGILVMIVAAIFITKYCICAYEVFFSKTCTCEAFSKNTFVCLLTSIAYAVKKIELLPLFLKIELSNPDWVGLTTHNDWDALPDTNNRNRIEKYEGSSISLYPN